MSPLVVKRVWIKALDRMTFPSLDAGVQKEPNLHKQVGTNSCPI